MSQLTGINTALLSTWEDITKFLYAGADHDDKSREDGLVHSYFASLF